MKLDQTRKLYVEDTAIGAIGVGETFEYLGVMFGPNGVVHSRLDLSGPLERIDRAPLKPQQEMEVLSTFPHPQSPPCLGVREAVHSFTE